MSGDVRFILGHIQAGRKIRFIQDFYGGQYVELPWTFLGWPKRRIKLSPQEAMTVRDALHDRRRKAPQPAVA